MFSRFHTKITFVVFLISLIFLCCANGVRAGETQEELIETEDEESTCQIMVEEFYQEAPSLCEPIDKSEPFDADPAPLAERMGKIKLIALKLGASSKVATMLAEVVAVRESSAYPSQLHRLAADQKANSRTWYKYRSQHTSGASKQRYSFGHGPYGHNTSLALKRWGDWSGPPEILCDPWVATAIYLRAMQRAWHEYAGDLPRGERRIFCDGDRFYGSGHRSHRKSPTLADLHRYASGGKACPRPREHRLERSFRRRMSGRKLRANYTPKLGDLGYQLHNHEILALRENALGRN